MPLLNLGNRRSAQAGNAGEIGKLDYRIGNPIVGQGVFLTGATEAIPTSGATANVSTEQEALSTTAEEAFGERLTRRSGIIQNLDSTITVYVGVNAQVASTTGRRLLAGESMPWNSTAAVWAVAASGTPSVAFVEFYD